MGVHPAGWATVAAAGTMALGATAAMAATQTVSTNYQFPLDKQQPPQDLVQLLQSGDEDLYLGSSSVTLAQFDSQGGTRALQQVKLSLDMDLAGTIYVYDDYGGFAALQAPPAGQVEFEMQGDASTGPLSAVIDFDDLYEDPTNGVVFINESGSAEGSTTTDFASFIGAGGVGIDLQAMVEVVYELAQVGGTQGLTASGTVELEYTYQPAGTIIPTPAAAAMGMMLLAAAGCRRSQRA